MRHHRVSLLDAGLFAGTIIAAGVIAFEYDFSGTLPQDKRIEFQEAIALGIVVIFGIVYFGWRRVIEQEREIARRIAADGARHQCARLRVFSACTGAGGDRGTDDLLALPH